MLKSVGAVFAGLIFIFVTHIGTDAVMHVTGVFPPAGQPMFDTGQLLIASLYRGIYSIIGCYITARLAPRNSMKHALILGGIGVLLSTAGAIAFWDMGPAWYLLGLIALSLPYAWLGGKLFEIRQKLEGSMRKLIVFNQVSLDGFFTDAKGDMSWAHKHDPEWIEFVNGNASGEAEALFGRKTYELMASYWPTPMAAQQAPIVAKAMNEMPKVVFSRTLKKAEWSNTRLVNRGLASAVRKMKSEAGPDMVIMGSGSIVSQLTHEGLIDQYQIVVNPIVLGKGRTLFEGVKGKLSLTLTKTRTFKNGNVLLTYELVR